MPVVAAYPNAVPSFTTKADDIDTVFADHINILQAEVAAIAAALGTQPAATYGTVKARIAAAEASAAASAAHFDSGGLIPQAGVVGLPAALSAVTATANSAQTYAAAAQAVWTAYTPTVTAPSGDPTFPAGSRIGRYLLLGKTLHVCVNITAAPTVVGNGIYAFGLPAGLLAANVSGSALVQTGSAKVTTPTVAAMSAVAELHPANNSFQVLRDDDTYISNATSITAMYASLVVEVQ